MAEAAGQFLAALEPDEAEIAARFMIGRAMPQSEEKRLQISGRANMLEGDLGRVVRVMRFAGADATDGRASAAPVPARSRTMRPLKPMLAQPADDIAAAFSILGSGFALEHKFDGARVQVHLS